MFSTVFYICGQTMVKLWVGEEESLVGLVMVMNQAFWGSKRAAGVSINITEITVGLDFLLITLLLILNAVSIHHV